MESSSPLLALLFWGSALALGYVYLGYPALVWAWATLRGQRPVSHAPDALSVTVLIVAHNEAARVTGRIQNLLAQDYPAERLQIVIASDGSTDETVQLARVWEPDGVEVIAFEARRGKPAVLND